MRIENSNLQSNIVWLQVRHHKHPHIWLELFTSQPALRGCTGTLVVLFYNKRPCRRVSWYVHREHHASLQVFVLRLSSHAHKTPIEQEKTKVELGKISAENAQLRDVVQGYEVQQRRLTEEIEVISGSFCAQCLSVGTCSCDLVDWNRIKSTRCIIWIHRLCSKLVQVSCNKTQNGVSLKHALPRRRTRLFSLRRRYVYFLFLFFRR